MEKDLSRIPIPEFIRHYWIAKKTQKDSPNVREKHLYRMVANTVKDKQSEAISLAQDFGKSALDYARISDHSLWPDDPAFGDSLGDSLADLRLFRVTQMNPLLLNAMQEFSSSADIAKTFRVVANFAFRYFIIGNQSPGNIERVSTALACDIRAKTYTSPRHIADALRAVSPDPAFRSDFSLASVEGRRIARYMLAKINNHLARQSSRTGSEHISNPDAKQVNLEHVLPESNPATWRPAFASGVNPKDYVYRIGNLTLLGAKINRDAADKSFADKKTIALDNSSLKINEIFRTIPKWDERQIEQRQDGMAKVALEVWKL